MLLIAYAQLCDGSDKPSWFRARRLCNLQQYQKGVKINIMSSTSYLCTKVVKKEGTEGNNEAASDKIVTEPTTKQEARILIAKLKDLGNCIEFFAEDQRLEKIEIDSEIFDIERAGEIAPYTLWQQSRQAKEEIKNNQEQHEKVKRVIRDIEREWDISEGEIGAIGPWQDSLDNYRSRVDLSYGGLYDFVNRRRGD